MWTHVQCMACVFISQNGHEQQKLKTPNVSTPAVLPVYMLWFIFMNRIGEHEQSQIEGNKNKTDLQHFNQNKNVNYAIMYRSNQSFNTPFPPGHPSPPPPAFDVFENYCSNSPLHEPKCRSNALGTLGFIQMIKCPHSGDISQACEWQKDGRNAFSFQTKSL